MAEKQCTKCGETKPLEAFGVQQRRGRATPQSACKACRAEAAKQFYASTRKRQRALQKQAFERNRDKRLQAMRDYHAANRAGVLARKAGYYTQNRPTFLAANAKRRAAEFKATTQWEPELDALVMSEAYDLAARRAQLTGGEWQVDHVVPLRGKAVCGLHNAYNVQVVPAKYNLEKNNKFDEGELHQRRWL